MLVDLTRKLSNTLWSSVTLFFETDKELSVTIRRILSDGLCSIKPGCYFREYRNDFKLKMMSWTSKLLKMHYGNKKKYEFQVC